MSVRVGTSGWWYRDWDGPVYPKGLRPADRLDHYASRFPTVEVNSTFYREPTPAVVRGWLRKARDHANLEFTVKAPQALTQDALAEAAPEEAARLAHRFVERVARPLADAGRLGVVLLQLSPGVLRNEATLARLDAALAALDPHPAAVEFRNRSWLADDAGLHGDALATLDRRGAALVVVDGPPFPALYRGEADHAYVRFHGHNRDVWYRGRQVEEDESDPRMNRYDYRYGREALEPWADRVARLAQSKRAVRVYFNNHPEGQAYYDAGTLEALLREREAPVEVAAPSPQRRLPF